MPEIGFVTMFWPLITVAGEEIVVQIADGPRFVLECRLNPLADVGQLKITFDPVRLIDICGGLTVAGNEMLNTVPEPVPKLSAVPYSALSDRINP